MAESLDLRRKIMSGSPLSEKTVQEVGGGEEGGEGRA